MRHALGIGSAVALAVLAGCSSKSIPAGDSDVDIQASTTATSDVKYIDILVHQLSDGALVYDSGIVPSSDFQDTRQHLEEVVALAGSTDFLFDANAYDTNMVFLKAGNQVQEATQPAGHSTTILIVIDLNSGDTNPTAPADITAVTDNIPILSPPTLSGTAGSLLTLHYTATDEDQDTDAGPIDSIETLTFFSTILSGNVDLSSNTNPGLFTEGPAFSFTFNDSQPVKILSAVVDRLNQLTFAITEIDPVSGSFQTVEYGEGYAVFDGNTEIPAPRAVHHDRNGTDPTGPMSGPIAVVVLKHGKPNPALGGGYSVECISRSDDSLVVTPANVAYWNDATVASFNRYEEQPDMNGNIVVDFKLRVAFAPPPAASVASPNPNAPLIVDTVKFSFADGVHFTFEPDITEAATFTAPEIDGVSGGASPGAAVEVDGDWFTGAYDPATALDPSQANDQRQVYLQDASDSTHYVYPDDLQLDSDGELTFDLPAGIAGGDYFTVVCSYGRWCTTSASTFNVAAPPPPSGNEHILPVTDGSTLYYPSGIDNAGEIVGNNSAESASYFWEAYGDEPQALPTSSGAFNEIVAADINNNGVIVGYEDNAANGPATVWAAIYWDVATLTPHELPVRAGSTEAQALRVNDSGFIVGGDTQTGLIWVPNSDSYSVTPLAGVPNLGGVTVKTYPSGINVNGEIIADAIVDNGSDINEYRAYVYANMSAAATPLPAPSDTNRTNATALNDSGLITGVKYYLDTNGNISGVDAFVWVPDGSGSWNIVNLPHTDPILGITSWATSDINAEGDIVGFGTDSGASSFFGTPPLLWKADGPGNWDAPIIMPVMYSTQPQSFIQPRMNDSDEIIGTDSDNVNFIDGAVWTQ